MAIPIPIPGPERPEDGDGLRELKRWARAVTGAVNDLRKDANNALIRALSKRYNGPFAVTVPSENTAHVAAGFIVLGNQRISFAEDTVASAAVVYLDIVRDGGGFTSTLASGSALPGPTPEHMYVPLATIDGGNLQQLQIGHIVADWHDRKHSIVFDTSDRKLMLENDEDSPGVNKRYGTNSAGVRGWQSTSAEDYTQADILVKDSITKDASDEDKLHLVGDAAAPGATRYYGTNPSAQKGWYDLVERISETVTNIIEYGELREIVESIVREEITTILPQELCEAIEEKCFRKVVVEEGPPEVFKLECVECPDAPILGMLVVYCCGTNEAIGYTDDGGGANTYSTWAVPTNSEYGGYCVYTTDLVPNESMGLVYGDLQNAIQITDCDDYLGPDYCGSPCTPWPPPEIL